MRPPLFGAIVLTLVASAAGAVDLGKCDMCHKPAGKPASAIPGGLAVSAHAGLSCLTCHVNASQPHKSGVATRGCGACHGKAEEALAASAHGPSVAGAPECYTCHGSGHGVVTLEAERFSPAYAPRICTDCHTREGGAYLEGAHAKAASGGEVGVPACISCHEAGEYLERAHAKAVSGREAGAPTCHSCHGEAHKTEPVAMDPRLSAIHQPVFCGGCHTGKAATRDLPFSIPDPPAQLLASVHGRINKDTGRYNANCGDCHLTHGEQPGWWPSSSTHFMNVAETCGRCHPDELALYEISVHGLATAAGLHDAPTCPDCHGDHNVVSGEVAVGGKRTRIVATCSSCHFSLAVTAKFDIANDRVQSFERSYHGVVYEGGKTTAADCGSCHRVHDVLPASDPRSSVHVDNLEATCGSCHIRVRERFTGTNVHKPREHPRRKPADYVAIVYVGLIFVVLGGMLLHNAVDYVGKVRAIRRERHQPSKVHVRLRPVERIQHLVLVSSFTLLAFTGFAIKFPSSFFFAWLVHLEGPYSIRVWLHKVFAVVLIAASLFHVGYLLFTRHGRARLKAIWPRVSDVREAVQAILHRVGLSKRAPDFGEFNYAEKAEYWALIWGTALMVLTGLYVWLDPYIQQLFPYWLYEVLRTIHFYEAILAVSSIVIWHFYHVIFDPSVYPMNFAWLDGKIPEKLIVEERKRYLEKLRRSKGEVEPETKDEAED
ncbi:MAG: cytochrome b/b6 domain-containing protein [bacterium]